ncbi:MAG: bactoprenol glucosyl transferase [Alphaproteobacteria bacterium]|nr:MAG: bactoprenol glucosyl transferase [Alphaproteobacteria bacterium]
MSGIRAATPETDGATEDAGGRLPAGPQGGAVELSVVVPVYNEETALGAFFDRLYPVLLGLGLSFEVVCINDGSRDRTLDVLLDFQRKLPGLKVVDFARNFGKEVALTAGLDLASGRAVVMIDSDLQHPPELIATFLEKWREGHDIVYGVRRSRLDETATKRYLTRMFYRLLNSMSEVSIPPDAGDFRLMDGAVVEALRGFGERSRFMKGLFAWVGFSQVAVPFDVENRVAGSSKWSLVKLWNFAIEGFVSFSSVPLRIWSYIGAAIALLAFLYTLFIVVRTLAFGADVPGFASIIAAIFFFSGIQLLGLGILGEYLARIFSEVKRRPIYIIRRRFGFDGGDR